MGATYGQFCPVAMAMELLDERWTMLVVRELVSGSERFNELRRGLPRMSRSLLSKRLQQLVRAGGAAPTEGTGRGATEGVRAGSRPRKGAGHRRGLTSPASTGP